MAGEHYKVETEHKRLPDGWEWQHWPDGSGSLRAPDGTGYFSYDLKTREFRLAMEHPVWEYHPALSLDEFIAYAEGEVLEYLKKQRKKSGRGIKGQKEARRQDKTGKKSFVMKG